MVWTGMVTMKVIKGEQIRCIFSKQNAQNLVMECMRVGQSQG